MEVWEVVGVDTQAQMNFKTENRVINGVKWMLVGDAPADQNGRFRGSVVREQFISNERLRSLNVAPVPGDIITIYFNRYGDVAKVDIAAVKQ